MLFWVEKSMEKIRNPSKDFSSSPDEAIILLRSIPLLQSLPEETLKKLNQAVQPVRFGAGEPIVRLNHEGDRILYIIWKGEAKVVSPQNEYSSGGSSGHTESRLSCGDYFGIMGPLRERYKVDVVAIDEVLCLVLAYEDADLLSAASIWDWDAKMHGTPSSCQQILHLETVESIGDIMKLESPRFQNFYFPFHYFLEGKYPVHRFKVADTYFGGQLVAQALAAATKSVHPEQLVHSLHSYFIRLASVSFSVVYQVKRIRDGRLYATRQVKAIQNDKLVFILYASFKREEGQSFEHAYPMPSVPGPEEAITLEQRLENYLCDPRFPFEDKKKYAGLKVQLTPIEVRYIDPSDSFQPVKLEPRQHLWIRSRAEISGDQNFHRCVGAYASDLPLLGISTLPHPETVGVRMRIVSLDHTIWFHRSFNAHDWLLFVIECPVSAGGRGLCLARFYTTDGKLVMTVAQEGVVRFLEENEVQAHAKL